MRVKLALNFVFFVLLLYCAGALSAVGIFKYGMHRATDALLQDLLAEISPAVQISEKGNPTLKSWANVATIERMPVLATIQIFDTKNKLLEHYGPPGVPEVHTGRITSDDGNITMSSLATPIVRGGRNYGALEIQVSTEKDDQALEHLVLAMVLAVPIIGGMVASAGYIFAGMALRPVEKTMELLRRFVADAGHELRTPLSIIEASIETLEAIHEQNKIPDSETEMIRKASNRMRSLTDDLMFLAKVEDPMAPFEKVTLNLNHLIEEVVAEYEPIALSHQISLSFDEQSKDVEILAEPETFRQLISNLLSNAIKYNDPGGTVSVLLKRDSGTVSITVSDTGIGISEASLSNVFDRFYREDKSRKRSGMGGGAGLGLAIVKAVSDAHNATVTVDSQIGKGTTFVVSLPQ